MIDLLCQCQKQVFAVHENQHAMLTDSSIDSFAEFCQERCYQLTCFQRDNDILFDHVDSKDKCQAYLDDDYNCIRAYIAALSPNTSLMALFQKIIDYIDEKTDHSLPALQWIESRFHMQLTAYRYLIRFSSYLRQGEHQ